MSRLTERWRSDGGSIAGRAICKFLNCPTQGSCRICHHSEVNNRLAEYEDKIPYERLDEAARLLDILRSLKMTKERAMRLAAKWANGGVCTLREGEAEEYHKLCLEALRGSKWIPVTERLPKHYDTVLICVRPYIKLVTATWDEFGYVWITKPTVYEFEAVTHWMPLPEPPDMGDENQ